MTSQEQDAFLKKAEDAAREANHIWPKYAACEAALESAWGASKLARLCNNLFGQKAGGTSKEWPRMNMKTREVVNGVWKPDDATWPVFPDWVTCFKERMELLRTLKCYKPALEAQTGEDFVLNVSKAWATDPERGHKVLQIFRKHF